MSDIANLTNGDRLYLARLILSCLEYRNQVVAAQMALQATLHDVEQTFSAYQVRDGAYYLRIRGKLIEVDVDPEGRIASYEAVTLVDLTSDKEVIEIIPDYCAGDLN